MKLINNTFLLSFFTILPCFAMKHSLYDSSLCVTLPQKGEFVRIDGLPMNEKNKKTLEELENFYNNISVNPISLTSLEKQLMGYHSETHIPNSAHIITNSLNSHETKTSLLPMQQDLFVARFQLLLNRENLFINTSYSKKPSHITSFLPLISPSIASLFSPEKDKNGEYVIDLSQLSTEIKTRLLKPKPTLQAAAISVIITSINNNKMKVSDLNILPLHLKNEIEATLKPNKRITYDDQKDSPEKRAKSGINLPSEKPFNLNVRKKLF